MPSRMLSTKQICEWLGISDRTLRRYRDMEGKLRFPEPIVMPFGNRWREDVVQAWIGRAKRHALRHGRLNETAFGEAGREERLAS